MKKLLVFICLIFLSISLLACVQNPETTIPEIVPEYADGEYDLSNLDGYDKAKIFAAMEEYLVKDVIGGIPVYRKASYTMYSERVSHFSNGYNGVMEYGDKFSTLLYDDSNVLMYDDQYGDAGEYTWRLAYLSDPETLNHWECDESDAMDIISMFTGTLYGFYYDESHYGFELLPSLAKSEPIAVGGVEVDDEVKSKVWQIEIKDDLVWDFNSNFDVSTLPSNAEDLTAEDFIDTWELAFEENWFRARAGGGDFVSYGVLGAYEYFYEDGLWDNVGLRLAEDSANTIEIEFKEAKSMFDVKYMFSTSRLSPINVDLYNSLERSNGTNSYGLTPRNVASSGVYTIEEWRENTYIDFDKNYSHPLSGIYHYTGYQYRYVENYSNVFDCFKAGKLDTALVPSSEVNDYFDNPNVRINPENTLWRININGFGDTDSRDAYMLEYPELDIDNQFIPEPILGDIDMKRALYFALNRETLTSEIVPSFIPDNTYFSSSYLISIEPGITTRSTSQGRAILDDYGYDLDLANQLFRSSVNSLITSGDFYTVDQSTNTKIYYDAETATEANPFLIDLTLVYSSNANTDLIVADIERQYEEALYDSENHVGINIVLIEVDFPSNYFDYALMAATDLSFGGVSGNIITAPFMTDVYRDDLTTDFVMDWGIDTHTANIVVRYINSDGIEVAEIWSFNALSEALKGNVIVEDGVIK